MLALTESRKTFGKKFKKRAVSAAKVLARSSLKVGVKLATMGAPAAADFEEAAKELSSEAEDLTDKYLGKLLTNQKEQKKSIESFRQTLSELPASLVQTKDAITRPLVFIIDELDRCRPSFALEVLERIKHFLQCPTSTSA